MSRFILSFGSVLRRNRSWLWLLVAVALAGCHRSEVKVYQLSSDDSSSSPAPANSTMGAPGSDENNTGQPPLQWTLPGGWAQVAPGTMSVASFKVNGPSGAQADVSIVPLPGPAGGQNANVNRWRGQVGLSPATADDLKKMAQPIPVGDRLANLYDLAGPGSNGGKGSRILGVIQERAGTTWFFKMMGDATLVEQQKPEFAAFLKSLTFTAAAQPPGLPPGHPALGGSDMNAPAAATGDTDEAHPVWTVPANWQAAPAGQFVTAEYSIVGTNGGTATVDAAELAGDGGGILANVNRWREQIGLNPVDETALATLTRTVKVTGGQATFVDMTGSGANGQPARLVAAMVPTGGKTWFYKLIGSENVVASQEDAFTTFVRTARYSNAP